MFNQDGEPVDSAELLLTLSSVEPRGRIPFRADFRASYDGVWPEFFIDAVPEDPYRSSPLWTAPEPRLFFTSQGRPIYLLEINNTAFAPQQIEGMLTLSIDSDLLGVLPVRSPAPIPAQSSWFFTLEPSLALPAELREDEIALQQLSATLQIDPVETHGVKDEVLSVDLEVSAVETIGGSIYLQGLLHNPTDQELVDPVVYATLRDTDGVVITANSLGVAERLPKEASLSFTIPLWLPGGVDPSSLEFDLHAAALNNVETSQGGN
jgi:hypothetical protein